MHAYPLVRELHHSQVMPGVSWTTEAVILTVGELKNVSVRSQRGQVEAVPLLHLILGDLTGPIAMECWRGLRAQPQHFCKATHRMNLRTLKWNRCS